MNKNIRSIKKVWLLPLLIVFVFALAGVGQEILAGDALKSVSPVMTMGDAKVEVGSSEIVRREDGVFVILRTTKLPPGEAVTMWLVVFNKPEYCSDPCNADDLENPTVCRRARY